jgi:hypothetical protein
MPDLDREKMVGWYDPGQLLRTASEVVISTIFGRNADQRLIEALFADPDDVQDEDLFHDYSHDPELWLDYVADLGDGWNSTYAVAYQASQAKLSVDYAGTRYDTVRGRALIFGGDEVYPTASRAQYKRRTFHPYDCAFHGTSPSRRPGLFAIPGNHDWYDSLVSFTRYFIDKDDIAGFCTPQLRSYFAIKLPQHWWLLAADTQLGSYIDGPQTEYFKKVAAKIQDGDGIIICNAEPVWIYDHLYKHDDPNIDDRNLDFLENTILKNKSVRIFLAGDLHHYRRHAAEDQTQKITAGGGGAFLHPTHGADVSSIREEFEEDNGAALPPRPPRTFVHKTSWPSPDISRRLCWKNMFFPILNPKFGIVPAIFYLLSAWSVMAPIGDLGLSQIGTAVHVTLLTALNDPLAVFWTVTLFLGFWLFTDTHVAWYRWTAGTIHGLAHVLAVFLIGWGSAYAAVQVMGLPFRSIPQLLVSGAFIFVGGYFVGSFLLGVYLLISLNLFGRHANEAFSALKVEDWKHFLRLKIASDGSLTIFPIGIRRVPRRWAASQSGASGPRFLPNDPQATEPELIEAPITIRRLPRAGAPPAQP